MKIEIKINGITIPVSEELKAQILKEKEKVWSRENLTVGGDNTYWFLFRDSMGGFNTCSGNGQVIESFTFPTKELAEQEAHIHRTMMLMRNWARFHNELDGFVADWGNEHQAKWGIYINGGSLYVHSLSVSNLFIFQISVSSRERAEQMREEFKDDLNKIKW